MSKVKQFFSRLFNKGAPPAIEPKTVPLPREFLAVTSLSAPRPEPETDPWPMPNAKSSFRDLDVNGGDK